MAGRAPLAESVCGCGDAGGAVRGPGSDAARAESGWAALGTVSPRSTLESGCGQGGAWQGRAVVGLLPDFRYHRRRPLDGAGGVAGGQRAGGRRAGL